MVSSMAQKPLSSFSSNDYSSLSLADLLAARDQFHLHLMHKANVVGTAVGMYRIRKSDPLPSAPEAKATEASNVQKPPRTLQNSEVRDYSWPSILVFVSAWEDIWDVEQRTDLALGDFIPPAVYMPNGDKVPLCVILAESCEPTLDTAAHLDFPQNLSAGAFPFLRMCKASSM